MLKLEDAEDTYKYNNRWYCVFRCIRCKIEIHVIRGRAAKHSGLCADCNRKQPKNQKQPFEWLYNLLKTQARLRNIPVSISFEEFLFLTEVKICKYCGGPVKWHPHSRQGSSAINLDRLDSNKGYDFDNVAVCCFKCNDKKSDWLTGDEFQLVSDLLRIYRSLDEDGKSEIEYMIISWKDEFETSNN